jgi:hypothetical protein
MAPRRPNPKRRQTIKKRLQSGGSSHTVDLVIARYKEDLAWLQEYAIKNRFRKIIIYNKGPRMMCPTNILNCEIVPLKNVGVCDHTYLYHIVHKYNDLADLTVFAPASADMHHKKDRLNKVIQLSRHNKPALFGFHVGGLREHLQDFNLTAWEVSDPDNKELGESYRLAPAFPRPFGLWMDTYLPGSKCPYVTYMGIFNVSKEMIHKHPVSFYRPFLDQLSHHKYPEAAHYMERAWAALFWPFPPEYFRY